MYLEERKEKDKDLIVTIETMNLSTEKEKKSNEK